MDRRLDRGQQTRHRIVATAAALFTEHGFEGVSIDAVLQATAMSRGALYHHFRGKEALFTAVLEAEEARVAAQLVAAAQGAANPLDALRAGCAAWLALAAEDAAVRQVVLTDAPAVVGWHAWRTMDGDYSLGLLRAALAVAAGAGRLPEDRIDIFAHVLMASLVEVALLIARAPADAALAQAGADAVEQVLSGLFGLPPNAAWPDPAAA